MTKLQLENFKIAKVEEKLRKLSETKYFSLFFLCVKNLIQMWLILVKMKALKIKFLFGTK